MFLYERFGITREGIDPKICLEGLQAMQHLAGIGSLDGLAMLTQEQNHIALRYYLMGDQVNAEKHAREVVPAALAYLLGDWRKKTKTDEGIIDPAWWHGREAWMQDFRSALFWGSVFDDWKSLTKLAAYPNERRLEKEIDTTPAYRQWLLDVAMYLRGEPVRNVAVRLDALSGAEWRATRLLGASLDAIAAKDARAASESLRRFLLAHHKRRRTKQVTDTISMDATFMVNLARREGLEVSIDPSLTVYLVALADEKRK